MADEPVEIAKRALISFVFQQSQPSRGDVFSWFDDRADEIATAVLAAVTPAIEARVAGEIVAIIAKHSVASCNCLTKTPQAAFHLETCPYQRIALILDEIDERGDHKETQ